ncbi:MAG: SdpI family protein [Candidatus Cloacimonas acidaminovorans]|nr:SdpI family protein [Candidatus Cloacimonas acidaminovorans]OQB07658.1 MAG: Immunity protein SdpI [Candidatus Cloacimonetes bacterium ADurb.Bin211]
MKLRKSEIISLLIIMISFIIGISFYSLLPDKVASHWNAKGEVDGYMSKFGGLFLMPVISLVLLLLFIIIPKIDPLKHNIEKFRKYFDGFIVLMMLFLFYLYILTILWNIGVRFNFVHLLVPIFSIFFYYCGILIQKAQRNWFIGIRTPWTLSNEQVWNKTHKIGGILFKIAGIISLIGILLPEYALFFVICPVILASLFPVIYSYFAYQKLTKS